MIPYLNFRGPCEEAFTFYAERLGEAKRLFRELADRGRIVLPFEQTFRSPRFGVGVDRLAITWQVNCA